MITLQKDHENEMKKYITISKEAFNKSRDDDMHKHYVCAYTYICVCVCVSVYMYLQQSQ